MSALQKRNSKYNQNKQYLQVKTCIEMYKYIFPNLPMQYFVIHDSEDYSIITKRQEHFQSPYHFDLYCIWLPIT